MATSTDSIFRDVDSMFGDLCSLQSRLRKLVGAANTAEFSVAYDNCDRWIEEIKCREQARIHASIYGKKGDK